MNNIYHSTRRNHSFSSLHYFHRTFNNQYTVKNNYLLQQNDLFNLRQNSLQHSEMQLFLSLAKGTNVQLLVYSTYNSVLVKVLTTKYSGKVAKGSKN